MTSFDKTKELIQSGVKAASSFVPQLQKLKTENSNVKYKGKACLSCNMDETFTIENIDIKVPENYTSSYAKEVKIELGDRLDVSTLNDKILNLTSSKNFNLIQLNNIKEILTNSPSLDENTTSSHLKFGLHYDPLYESSLLVNLTNKHIFRQNDILSTDLVFNSGSI